MNTIIDRAKYKPIHNGHTVLEAVYRMQEAGREHKCDFEDCRLGGRILPLMKYARVYYEDVDEVEKFHYACFVQEFEPDGD